MSTYTGQKFRLGTMCGPRLGDDPRGPPLEFTVAGGIVPTLPGG